ncbi:winged helix-turn-helix domain-containing protein [Candidatus Bathyarchaeota archaeon]|nr:winged helix-turn-helix domain-containing protein [Candidatus Bathyarchaeota archaeon]
MEKTDKTSARSDDSVLEKLEEMDNKLERIKSDTHSLNRVSCIANANVIKEELWKVVGRSEIRAAILFLTREEISFQDLGKALGIKQPNLSRELRPFMGNKGFIAELKKGANKYYQRSEQVDLIGFEREELFIKLLESWKVKRAEEAKTEATAPSKEETNAA